MPEEGKGKCRSPADSCGMQTAHLVVQMQDSVGMTTKGKGRSTDCGHRSLRRLPRPERKTTARTRAQHAVPLQDQNTKAEMQADHRFLIANGRN